jgi:hypothetical protein
MVNGRLIITLRLKMLIMNRSIIILVITCLFCLQGFSQEQKFKKKYPGTVKYQKTEQSCTIFEFAFPASQVEDGLIEFFKKQGAKPKESKGFFYAPSIRISEEDNKFYDVYYKIEKDGKEGSKVYAILTNLGEDPATRTSDHRALAATAAGAGIAAAMIPALDDHDLNVQLKRQEDEIKKGENKLSDLMDDSKQLEKKRTQLEQDIENNKQSQLKAQQDLEAKRQRYQDLLERSKKRN